MRDAGDVMREDVIRLRRYAELWLFMLGYVCLAG